MQTTRYRLWKSALWVLGILAYGLGTTVLSVFVARSLFYEGPYFYQIGRSLGTELLGRQIIYADTCVLLGLWVGLLAVAAWQVTVHRHRTAGRTLAVMAGIAVLLSLYLGNWLSTGQWWLGYVGVSNPSPVIDICDGAGCADHFATQTAEAPHPPAWWPSGH